MTRADAPRTFNAGDAVQTPLGRGVVREARNSRRVLVDVQGRALIFEAAALAAVTPAKPAKAAARAHDGAGPRRAADVARQVDLHGLHVDAALERVDRALDRAMQDDVAELHIIHGRSGGRLRQAVHKRLSAISSIRAFGVDPRNAGVTIVRL